jgi:hypothetical protein
MAIWPGVDGLGCRRPEGVRLLVVGAVSARYDPGTAAPSAEFDSAPDRLATVPGGGWPIRSSMHADDELSSLRGGAERAHAELLPERAPSALGKAAQAARDAGQGAEIDDLVKPLVFAVVLVKELLPERWRRRQQPIAIEAVRLRPGGDDSHIHVVEVRSTDGRVRPVREVMFGVHYRREVYVAAAEDGEPVNVIVSRCQTCGQRTLSTEVNGKSPLLALPRF